MLLRDFIPSSLAIPLWGNRKRWGLIPDTKDPDWKSWQKRQSEIYMATQRAGVGSIVNDAGYKVMSSIDLADKTVLEIGPGDIRHMKNWRGVPAEYLMADISEDMMAFAKKSMVERGIAYRTLSVSRNQPLALEDGSVDVIVSFYSLEHLYPLSPYLEEFKRLLKPGGYLIGAIPAEGGLAWGGGRILTSRRWFKKNTTIDPDKIICWEHPNFADQILDELDQVFTRETVQYWPLSWLPLLDTNLVIRLLYRKAAR